VRTADLLQDGYGRIAEVVAEVLDGIDDATLLARVEPGSNTVAWLVWHLVRVQDDHLADAFGARQVWADGWAERFGLPLDPRDTGYGHDDAQVGAVRAGAALLLGYAQAVHERSLDLLASLSDEDLERVVDTRWDPPVTLGVRLVSVLADDLQHAGQAAYLRGLLERRGASSGA
jgi:uncharacterized damage-inducible protein DinB